MARRPSLIKIKQKKMKKSRSEQYLVNLKGFGIEPTYTSKELTQAQLGQRFNWYNAMCDQKEAREYIEEYLKNTNRLDELKAFKSVPDKWVPTTAAWIARIRSQGGVVPQSSIDFFEDRVKTAISEAQRRAREDNEEPEGMDPPSQARPSQKPSVQDRMKKQLDFWMCELEEELDKFVTTWQAGFDMYAWLQKNQVPPVQANRIFERYNPQLLEIESVVEKKAHADIAEGYQIYKGEKLQKLYGFLVMVVEDAEKFSQNEKKKTRKPRTPKPITADKKLKDFKHQNFDNDLKIQSVQPEKILGAAEVWTFSTKYNQLSVFRMIEKSNGLDVHRTAIAQYDEANSFTKKLRANDVASVLKEVLEGGKVTLRNLMKTVRGSDQKLQVRMNENTLLLRATPR